MLKNVEVGGTLLADAVTLASSYILFDGLGHETAPIRVFLLVNWLKMVWAGGGFYC